ncbi:MAG TPA: AAA family ATPase, partial [Methanomicrobiales archaeon]|nr:AAA family ATPase [Methanomicrobiales archaeon]
MQIERIIASNFKTFHNLNITLGPYNVLIGTNAAGKSNFIDILKFMRDIARHGLKNAISLQG